MHYIAVHYFVDAFTVFSNRARLNHKYWYSFPPSFLSHYLDIGEAFTTFVKLFIYTF